jgi:hypothetical protein
MQEALGADFTDLNWFAQPSSNDLATDQGRHSFPRISFTSLIRAIEHNARLPDGMPTSRRRLCVPLFQGYPHRITNKLRLDIEIDPVVVGGRAICADQRDYGFGAEGWLSRGSHCLAPDRRCVGYWM